MSASPSPKWRLAYILLCLVASIHVEPGGSTPAVVPCPHADCRQLWLLPRVTTGPTLDELNQASGFNHSVLVLVTNDTTADLQTAQQQFVNDTLISSHSADGAPAARVYLGPIPGELYIAPGTTLTWHELHVVNVLATLGPVAAPASLAAGPAPPPGPLSPANSTSGTPAPQQSPALLSLSLDSFSLSRGSLLRLVRCELVLADCAVAASLHRAAGEAGGGGLAWDATRTFEPDVRVHYAKVPLGEAVLELVDVDITCNKVCGPSAVRTLTVESASDWYHALRVVDDHSDGCVGYDIRVTTSLSADGSAPAPPAPAALTQPQVSAPQPQPQPQPQPAGSGAGTPGGRRRLSGGAVGAQTPVGVVKTRESWAAHVGGGGSGRNAMWQHLRRGQARRDLLQDPAVPHIPTVTRIQVNVTVRGARNASASPGDPSLPPAPYVVLDLGLLRSALVLWGPESRLTLEDIVVTNLAAPHPGVLSLPLYIVDVEQRGTPQGMLLSPPRILMRNVTLVVPQDELSYETTWLKSVYDQPPSLDPDQVAWLRSSVQNAAAESLSSSALLMSYFRAWDMEATNLRITSVPPPGYPRMLPGIGISTVARSPLGPYPQIVVLSTTDALIAVLNASADPLLSDPANGVVTFPGCPTVAAVTLMPGSNLTGGAGSTSSIIINSSEGPVNTTAAGAIIVNRNATADVTQSNTTFILVPKTPIVLQRSIVLSPYTGFPASQNATNQSRIVDPILVDALAKPVVLDFDRAPSGSWATFSSSSSSSAPTLTLQYVTLVGLDSPSRWPAPALVRCLDLPLWALEAGSRLPSLAGEPPALVLAGATVAVSRQELGLWAACYQALTVQNSTTRTDPALAAACRGLGLTVFSAVSLGQHALRIRSLQGMGMMIRDTVLRDDITLYQRYDLGVLLPGDPVLSSPPPATGPPVFTNEYKDGNAAPHKWVIPVVVVGVTTLVSAVLLLAVWWKGRHGGGHQPYINVHMIKMMAESGIRPYAVDSVPPGTFVSIHKPGRPPARGPSGRSLAMGWSSPGGGHLPLTPRGTSFRETHLGHVPGVNGLPAAALGAKAVAVPRAPSPSPLQRDGAPTGPNGQWPFAWSPLGANLPPPLGAVASSSPMGLSPSAPSPLGQSTSGELPVGPYFHWPAGIWPGPGQGQGQGQAGLAGVGAVQGPGGDAGASLGVAVGGVAALETPLFEPGVQVPHGEQLPSDAAEAVRQAAAGTLSPHASPPLPPAAAAAAGAGLDAADGGSPEATASLPRHLAAPSLNDSISHRSASNFHTLISGSHSGPVSWPNRSSSPNRASSAQHAQDAQAPLPPTSSASDPLAGPSRGRRREGDGSLVMAASGAGLLATTPTCTRRVSLPPPLSDGRLADVDSSVLVTGTAGASQQPPQNGPSASIAGAMGGEDTAAALVPGALAAALRRTSSIALQQQDVAAAGARTVGGSAGGAAGPLQRTSAMLLSPDGRKGAGRLSLSSALLLRCATPQGGSSPAVSRRDPSGHAGSDVTSSSVAVHSGAMSGVEERVGLGSGVVPHAVLASMGGSGADLSGAPSDLSNRSSASGALIKVHRQASSGAGAFGEITLAATTAVMPQPLQAQNQSLVQQHRHLQPPQQQQHTAPAGIVAVGAPAPSLPLPLAAPPAATTTPSARPTGKSPSTPTRPYLTSRPSPFTAARKTAAVAAAPPGKPERGGVETPPRRSVLGEAASPEASMRVLPPQGSLRRNATMAPTPSLTRLSEASNSTTAGTAQRSDSGQSGPDAVGSRGSGHGGGGGQGASPPGDGAGGYPTGDGGATPMHHSGAKPGLGRLLVGSLSNLFRVDSLTLGAAQRPMSPAPGPGAGTLSQSNSERALGTSGPSGRALVSRGGRTAAGAGAGQGDAPLAPAGGSGVLLPTGTGMTPRVSAMGVVGVAPVGPVPNAPRGGLEAALSELTASVEGRLQENQLVIQQALGSGAFGTVYKGLWKGLAVAVKTMTLTSDAVTQGRHAALMEAALSKSIFHPHVVTTYTCDLKPMHVDASRVGAMTGLAIMNETEVIQEWRLYIVQEFCDGGSLRHAIEARSFLNPATGSPQLEWVLQMAREVAAGMQYLHEHNIVHGDLNPANVLLKRDDASVLGYAAKIADFGLSVHMHAEQSHVSNTKRGTPFYTAPEVTNAGNLTRFADVFSYGVLLWELYMSRSCWTYGAGGRLVHQRGFPHLPPTCPRSFASLVTSCMQPAHKQRPTFKQVGITLEAMQRELARANAAAWASMQGDAWWAAMSPQQQQQLLENQQQQQQQQLPASSIASPMVQPRPPMVVVSVSPQATQHGSTTSMGHLLRTTSEALVSASTEGGAAGPGPSACASSPPVGSASTGTPHSSAMPAGPAAAGGSLEAAAAPGFPAVALPSHGSEGSVRRQSRGHGHSGSWGSGGFAVERRVSSSGTGAQVAGLSLSRADSGGVPAARSGMASRAGPAVPPGRARTFLRPSADTSLAGSVRSDNSALLVASSPSNTPTPDSMESGTLVALGPVADVANAQPGQSVSAGRAGAGTGSGSGLNLAPAPPASQQESSVTLPGAPALAAPAASGVGQHPLAPPPALPEVRQYAPAQLVSSPGAALARVSQAAPHSASSAQTPSPLGTLPQRSASDGCVATTEAARAVAGAVSSSNGQPVPGVLEHNTGLSSHPVSAHVMPGVSNASAATGSMNGPSTTAGAEGDAAGGPPVASAAVAGVLAAPGPVVRFEVLTEVPRFARSDLPTVLEDDFEDAGSAANSQALSIEPGGSPARLGDASGGVVAAANGGGGHGSGGGASAGMPQTDILEGTRQRGSDTNMGPLSGVVEAAAAAAETAGALPVLAAGPATDGSDGWEAGSSGVAEGVSEVLVLDASTVGSLMDGKPSANASGNPQRATSASGPAAAGSSSAGSSPRRTPPSTSAVQYPAVARARGLQDPTHQTYPSPVRGLISHSAAVAASALSTALGVASSPSSGPMDEEQRSSLSTNPLHLLQGGSSSMNEGSLRAPVGGSVSMSSSGGVEFTLRCLAQDVHGGSNASLGDRMPSGFASWGPDASALASRQVGQPGAMARPADPMRGAARAGRGAAAVAEVAAEAAGERAGVLLEQGPGAMGAAAEVVDTQGLQQGGSAATADGVDGPAAGSDAQTGRAVGGDKGREQGAVGGQGGRDAAQAAPEATSANNGSIGGRASAASPQEEEEAHLPSPANQQAAQPDAPVPLTPEQQTQLSVAVQRLQLEQQQRRFGRASASGSTAEPTHGSFARPTWTAVGATGPFAGTPASISAGGPFARSTLNGPTDPLAAVDGPFARPSFTAASAAAAAAAAAVASAAELPTGPFARPSLSSSAAGPSVEAQPAAGPFARATYTAPYDSFSGRASMRQGSYTTAGFSLSRPTWGSGAESDPAFSSTPLPPGPAPYAPLDVMLAAPALALPLARPSLAADPMAAAAALLPAPAAAVHAGRSVVSPFARSTLQQAEHLGNPAAPSASARGLMANPAITPALAPEPHPVLADPSTSRFVRASLGVQPTAAQLEFAGAPAPAPAPMPQLAGGMANGPRMPRFSRPSLSVPSPGEVTTAGGAGSSWYGGYERELSVSDTAPAAQPRDTGTGYRPMGQAAGPALSPADVSVVVGETLPALPTAAPPTPAGGPFARPSGARPSPGPSPLPLPVPPDALNADPDHPRFSRATHGRRHDPHDLTPDLPGPAFAPPAGQPLAPLAAGAPQSASTAPQLPANAADAGQPLNAPRALRPPAASNAASAAAAPRPPGGDISDSSGGTSHRPGPVINSTSSSSAPSGPVTHPQQAQRLQPSTTPIAAMVDSLRHQPTGTVTGPSTSDAGATAPAASAVQAASPLLGNSSGSPLTHGAADSLAATLPTPAAAPFSMTLPIGSAFGSWQGSTAAQVAMAATALQHVQLPNGGIASRSYVMPSGIDALGVGQGTRDGLGGSHGRTGTLGPWPGHVPPGGRAMGPVSTSATEDPWVGGRLNVAHGVRSRRSSLNNGVNMQPLGQVHRSAGHAFVPLFADTPHGPPPTRSHDMTSMLRHTHARSGARSWQAAGQRLGHGSGAPVHPYGSLPHGQLQGPQSWSGTAHGTYGAAAFAPAQLQAPRQLQRGLPTSQMQEVSTAGLGAPNGTSSSGVGVGAGAGAPSFARDSVRTLDRVAAAAGTTAGVPAAGPAGFPGELPPPPDGSNGLAATESATDPTMSASGGTATGTSGSVGSTAAAGGGPTAAAAPGAIGGTGLGATAAGGGSVGSGSAESLGPAGHRGRLHGSGVLRAIRNAVVGRVARRHSGLGLGTGLAGSPGGSADGDGHSEAPAFGRKGMSLADEAEEGPSPRSASVAGLEGLTPRPGDMASMAVAAAAAAAGGPIAGGMAFGSPVGMGVGVSLGAGMGIVPPVGVGLGPAGANLVDGVGQLYGSPRSSLAAAVGGGGTLPEDFEAAVSGTSFDAALRLAKTSLSTVPESGPGSFSHTSLTPSSPGDGNGAGGGASGAGGESPGVKGAKAQGGGRAGEEGAGGAGRYGRVSGNSLGRRSGSAKGPLPAVGEAEGGEGDGVVVSSEGNSMYAEVNT